VKKKLRPVKDTEAAHQAALKLKSFGPPGIGWPAVPWEVVCLPGPNVYIRSIASKSVVCRIVGGDSSQHIDIERMINWGKRIVKCVDACEGVTNDTLDRGGTGFVEQLIESGLRLAEYVLEDQPRPTDSSWF